MSSSNPFLGNDLPSFVRSKLNIKKVRTTTYPKLLKRPKIAK
jgi:hypothetical protein